MSRQETFFLLDPKLAKMPEDKPISLVDTHCHLTHVDTKEIPAIIEKAKNCNVDRMVCIGASEGIKSAPESLKIAESFENIFCTIGVHPHDAGDFQSLEQIAKLAKEPKVVAIGETGLDFFRDWAPEADQKMLFKNTIDLAKEIKKPLIIHSREAGDETLKILKENAADSIGGVFHCYAEDKEFAKKLADINFLVSFTGNLTFKKATDRREAASGIPLNQIMLETDMPYMAPEPFRGKPSEPMHVLKIAETLAKVKDISLEEVAVTTSATADSFFGLQANVLS